MVEFELDAFSNANVNPWSALDEWSTTARVHDIVFRHCQITRALVTRLSKNPHVKTLTFDGCVLQRRMTRKLKKFIQLGGDLNKLVMWKSKEASVWNGLIDKSSQVQLRIL